MEHVADVGDTPGFERLMGVAHWREEGATSDVLAARRSERSDEVPVRVDAAYRVCEHGDDVDPDHGLGSETKEGRGLIEVACLNFNGERVRLDTDGPSDDFALCRVFKGARDASVFVDSHVVCQQLFGGVGVPGANTAVVLIAEATVSSWHWCPGGVRVWEHADLGPDVVEVPVVWEAMPDVWIRVRSRVPWLRERLHGKAVA